MSSIEPFEVETPRAAFDRSAKYEKVAESVFGKVYDSRGPPKHIQRSDRGDESPVLRNIVALQTKRKLNMVDE